jgi:O-antigen/teichoic acid export membrane protein
LHPAAAADERLLATHAPLADLAARSARAGLITVISHAAQLLIGVAGTMVLARMLHPSEFGLYAMVVSIAGFVIAVRDFGLPLAAIQQPQISHGQLSRLFWLNARLSAILCAALAVAAPVVAWFYQQPALRSITWALSAGIFINCLSMLHWGLLRRQMRFATVMWLEIGAMIAGLVAGLTAAELQWGVWSLVLQQVTIHLVQTIGAFTAYPWRPLAPSRDSAASTDPALASMTRYGKFVTATRAVTYVSRNLSEVLIGRLHGAFQLGLYDKADQWAILPFQQIYVPMLNVVVSSFSRLQDDVERYRAFFRRALATLFAITFPALALVILDAREAILLLFGAQWTDAAPIFRLLALATVASSVSQAVRWVYLSEGLTQREFRWTLIATPVVVLGISIGVFWGAVGVAWGFAIASAILAYPSVRYAMSGSKLDERDVWHPAWRPALLTLIAAIVVWQLHIYVGFWPRAAIVRIIVDGLTLLTIYAVGWMVTPRGRAEARELLGAARHFLPPR